MQEADEDGIEDAFDLVTEVPEKIRTGVLGTLKAPCRAEVGATCRLYTHSVQPSSMVFV
mgnify:CR=1 FL=1